MEHADGRIRWCWLELGEAALMLQEFWPGQTPKEILGNGINVCFQCEDALALYREFKSRGIQTRRRPFVGNGLWVVPVTDPDGYRMEFESPTDAPEETEIEEVAAREVTRPGHTAHCAEGQPLGGQFTSWG